MGASLFRAYTTACLVCATVALAVADGPAASSGQANARGPTTSTAPAPGFDDLTLALVLGDPAFRHDNTVTKAKILSDGRRLLTSGNDGTVRLWDLPTGRQLQCYRHGKDYLWDFLVLPGEEKLVTAGGEANVVLWDLKTAQRLAEFPHEKMTFRLALDANAARLAVGDEGGHCTVWDLAGKRELARFSTGGSSVYTVLFGRDGNSVIAGAADSTIRSWDLDSNRERFLKPKDRKLKLAGTADTDDIHTLAASPDGSRLVVCCAKRGPWLMDPASGRELWEANDVPAVLTAAWSPDGNSIAVSGSKQLWVLDANSGAVRWKADLIGGTHYGVAWSRDGNEVLCGSHNLLCRFAAAGASAGKRVYPPEGAPLQQDKVSDALPSPDGERIYECGSSPGIRVWDRAGRAVKETWLEKDEVRALALSADGMTLAVGADSFATAIDTRTGKEIHRYPNESGYGGGVALTPDGKMIVVCAGSGATVHRVATGETVADLSLQSGSRYYSGLAIAVSQDMELAVALGGEILVYKLPAGDLVQEIRPADQTKGEVDVSFPGIHADSFRGIEGQQEERFAGCAFVPGEASSLLTWGNKGLRAWAPPKTEANALSAAEVAALIEQLNADSYRDREAATKRLAAAGRAILPLLRAAQPKEAEQKARLEIVQKEILAAGKMRAVAALLLPEGEAHAFVLHPDGRHWALTRGDVASRAIVIGEFAGGHLRTICTLQPASATTAGATSTGAANPSAANTSAPSTLAFDGRGALIVGNCNGTISEYKPQPSSQPANQPATAPAK